MSSGEDFFNTLQRFWYFGSAGEDFRELFLECADNRAYLIRIDNVPVKLRGAVAFIFVLHLPPLFPGQALTLFHQLVGSDFPSAFGALRLNDINFVADVHAIADGFLTRVFTDHVLPEEAIGTIIRRRGKANQVRVKIVDDLPPEIVDRAVALISNNKIKGLDRYLRIIRNLFRCSIRR